MGSNAAETTCSLTTFCIMDMIEALKMDPPTAVQSQAALISLTGVIDVDTDRDEQSLKLLLVGDAQLLSPAEAEALKPMLMKMFYFAALSGQLSRKRAHELWSPEENLAKASPCRILGRSSAGPALPDCFVQIPEFVRGIA